MERIPKLIDEILADFLQRKVWIYVKMQTLLDLVIGDIFARFEYNRNANRNAKNLSIKLDKFNAKYGFDVKEFKKLNELANKIKHNSKNLVDFDEAFLNECFKNYNIILKKYFRNNPEYIINTKQRREKAIEKILNRNLSETRIHCGTNRNDLGFIIKIKQPQEADIPLSDISIFAIIYNFLQRSKNAKKSKFLCKQEELMGINIDFHKVYRCEMALLLMLRAGLVKKGVFQIKCVPDEKKNIELAFNDIVNYQQKIKSLCKLETIELALKFNDKGTRLSFIDNSADIKIENSQNISHSINNYNDKTDRDIWFAPNLIYKIDESKDRKTLEYFLSDFFGYSDFKPGQLIALIEVLTARQNKVCVMPTGAGKSLIYFMNSLLSPSPTIIISPTLPLVKDQQRNLLDQYNIDDCADFSCNDGAMPLIQNKFIYMTPDMVQSYDLVIDLINYNVNHMISNIVLDEIHTLCNWSHSFRPDYLILTHNLFTFISECKYLGFTATANSKVLNDIIRQLKIPPANIIQPVSFSAGKISFRYIKCASLNEKINELMSVIKSFLENREQKDDGMIIFTRNIVENRKLFHELAQHGNYDSAIFDAEKTYSYWDFVSGYKHILIADEEMGVGINLPNVVSVVHWGLPNSKAQYIQEIGRANRCGRNASSIVIFQGTEYLTLPEKRLFRYETSIDDVIDIIRDDQIPQETASLFSSILADGEESKMSIAKICSFYDEISCIEHFKIIQINKSERNHIQKYLYKLFLLGVVNNWYFLKSDSTEYCKLQIETEENDFDYIKQKALSYLAEMGEYEKYSYKIQNAENVKDIIEIFENWFYEEFLRYHREQILSVADLFDYYTKMPNIDLAETINNELGLYFQSTIKYINDEKIYIDKMTQEEVLSDFSKITSRMNAVAEELLTLNYNPKLDLICFIYQFNKHPTCSTSRLIRIIENLTSIEKRNLLDHIHKIYYKCSIDEKLNLINKLLEYYDVAVLLETIYKRCVFDEVYYGFLARELNKKMEGINEKLNRIRARD